MWARDIDRQRRKSGSNGAAARRTAANAGSAMSTAELRRLNTDLFCDTHFARYICYYYARHGQSHCRVTDVKAEGY